jgi:hypothetical protein
LQLLLANGQRAERLVHIADGGFGIYNWGVPPLEGRQFLLLALMLVIGPFIEQWVDRKVVYKP